MNYTKNYHLPQWAMEDRIMMEDFNRMCADMESGLDRVAQEAAADTAKAAADAAADTLTAKTAAQTAQATANKAVSDAAKAQATANAAYCPTNLPYVIGTYVGNGGTLTVTLGFKPKFLIVAHQNRSGSDGSSSPTGFAITGCGINIIGLELEDNGFTVSRIISGQFETAPHINANNSTYAYIAFR